MTTGLFPALITNVYLFENPAAMQIIFVIAYAGYK
jgi:hypothetical protein